jgi:hypothetical protein
MPVTVIALEVERGFVAPNFNTPADMVVGPEYVLVPESVSVPVPAFVKAMLPKEFRMIPENVVLALLPPVVSV